MPTIRDAIKQIWDNLKFTPASSEVTWERIETLVHGPGAGDDKTTYNSAVFACLQVISTSYPEPPLTVFHKLDDDQEEKIADHPLQDLLELPTPNGELSMDELLFWTAWAKHTDGNAYWVKVRSGEADVGNVVELWPVSPTLIAPKTVKDSGDWISYYEYQYAPGKITRIPVGNVVHFRLGIDDRDMRKGVAPLKALVRELATDEEADKFVSALLSNYAVPGLVVMPSGTGNLSDGDRAKIGHTLRQEFGTNNRGNIAVMSKESKIEQFGFSPEQLDMTMLHRIPEERISAVMGVPAILAGLGAGLDRSTFSNTREMGEMFTERKLVPQWRADAAKINVALKPDFTDDRDIYVAFDLKNVRALQEDENAKYERLQRAVAEKPFMLRNEARAEIGLDPLDEWDEEDRSPPRLPPMFQQQGDNGNGRQPQEEMEQEIRAWRRWATNRIEKKGGFDREFEVEHIPPALAGAISGALEEVKTVGDVERVFSDVWLGYP
jgi:HK97 family phage portal protein